MKGAGRTWTEAGEGTSWPHSVRMEDAEGESAGSLLGSQWLASSGFQFFGNVWQIFLSWGFRVCLCIYNTLRLITAYVSLKCFLLLQQKDLNTVQYHTRIYKNTFLKGLEYPFLLTPLTYILNTHTMHACKHTHTHCTLMLSSTTRLPRPTCLGVLAAHLFLSLHNTLDQNLSRQNKPRKITKFFFEVNPTNLSTLSSRPSLPQTSQHSSWTDSSPLPRKAHTSHALRKLLFI